MSKTPITVARGDGIGPEIMDATLKVLEAAGAQLDIDEIEIGEAVYARGIQNGIEESSWDSLRHSKVFLKAPITTPQGGGFKSLNVTVRKSLGLYANVRPCVSYHPYVETNFPDMDLVIVRENEEDLYAGIEHRQTQDVVQTIKLISRPGSERIMRFAFEYARANARKKVTCMSKDNIMKMGDGLFHSVFDEIGAEYPEIEQEHYIVDIGTARVAARPGDFDVIVTENLYGDIISDVAVEITGSVGLGGSCNVGDNFAMFEAVHGSAPDISGQNIANPSGLILGAVLMLNHIGQSDVASKVHNAWLRTLEDGAHTGDIFDADLSKEKLGTQEFADAVIARLGQKPAKFKAVDYGAGGGKAMSLPPLKPRVVQEKILVGADIFVHYDGKPDDLAARIRAVEGLELQILANRGVKVWPNGHADTFCSDHWCCRFHSNKSITPDTVLAQLKALQDAGLEFIKLENLYEFDGERGYTLSQGQ
jgi:isocitrate dehydrogenase